MLCLLVLFCFALIAALTGNTLIGTLIDTLIGELITKNFPTRCGPHVVDHMLQTIHAVDHMLQTTHCWLDVMCLFRCNTLSEHSKNFVCREWIHNVLYQNYEPRE